MRDENLDEAKHQSVWGMIRMRNRTRIRMRDEYLDEEQDER